MMSRVICAAASAAIALHAFAAAAQEAPAPEKLTPPPGYVLVPAPPPGYTLEPAPVERSWAVGAFVGSARHNPEHGDQSIAGAYVDLFLSPRLSMGLFGDQRSSSFTDVTSLGVSATGHFFGGPRSTHLRTGLGLSHDLRSHGGDRGVSVRAFLGGVVRIGSRASVFLQAMLQTSSFGRTSEDLGALNLGLELGN